MHDSGQTDRELSADARVVRTRATLKQALMQLLQQMDWRDITIIGICRRAGVARSSFYEHFATKADLLDAVFADRMTGIRLSARMGEPLATLDWLVDHVAEAPEFFQHAMAGSRGDALLPRFRTALIRRLAEELAARNIPDADAKAAYVIGGSMACLAEAADGNARAKLQDMAARILA